MKLTHRILLRCATIFASIQKFISRWTLRLRCIASKKVEESGKVLINYTLDDVEYIHMMNLPPNPVANSVLYACFEDDLVLECTDILVKIRGPAGDYHGQIITPADILLTFFPERVDSLQFSEKSVMRIALENDDWPRCLKMDDPIP